MSSTPWLPAQFYVFNGDADGICAVHQLKLAYPGESELITGVKRDVALLQRIENVTNKSIAVLDIAVEKNLPALELLLERGNHICWFDHHRSDPIPRHPNFQPHVETAKTVNTSRLVDIFLEERFQRWAIVGLFGDNIDETASELCKKNDLSSEQAEKLKELGRLLNYNAYGESLDDLHYTPMEMLNRVLAFEDPLAFIEQSDILEALREGRQSDLEKAWHAQTLQLNVFVLPYEKWGRRVPGEFGNELARRNPDQAHAVLVDNGCGGYVVSVRSPLNQSISAAMLCKEFATGGGRDAAAGINILPQEDVNRFIKRFNEHYGGSVVFRS